jgi:hypothetical protein
MDAGMKVVAILVLPGGLGLVLVFYEDGLRAPVVFLAWEVAVALDHQDSFAARCELVGQCPAAGAGPDDDDVVMGGHR